MRRPGHGRPVGTVARMKITWEAEDDREPELADVVAQTSYPGGDPAELERLYCIVGLEEPDRGRTWTLMMERLAWDDETAIDWTWYRKSSAR